MPLMHAAAHLLEEADGHGGELLLHPFVRRVVQVLVAPERREAAAIGEVTWLQTGLRHSW